MVLFIDACVRNESRTRRLAEVLLEKTKQPIEMVSLSDEIIPSLSETLLNKRYLASQEGSFIGSYYKYAKQFKKADVIVIATPFWDLSFPAILKQYFESILVQGLTFKYNSDGTIQGLCNAKKLYYVTTAGGLINNDVFGYGYIKELASVFFGIKECHMYMAEKLDIDGLDSEQILSEAMDKIRNDSGIVMDE